MSISRPRYQKKRRRYQTNRTGSKSRFERGFYKPINEDKYKAPMDKYMNSNEYPEYRSSWEKKFYKYIDLNEDVEYWTTEPFPIKYVSPKDNKYHRYYPDVLMKMNGIIYLVEIKPSNQCGDPINLAKWKEAKKVCDQKGIRFLVMTEKELKPIL